MIHVPASPHLPCATVLSHEVTQGPLLPPICLWSHPVPVYKTPDLFLDERLPFGDTQSLLSPDLTRHELDEGTSSALEQSFET